MNIGCIYMISSIIKPERQYIGSAVNYKNRISVHLNGLNNNKHHSKTMQRHCNKYGIGDLKFEIIEIVKDSSRLLIAEQSYLSMFNPYFNTCKTAGSNLGVKFGPMPEYHRKKISERNKGNRPSQKTIDGNCVKMHKYSIDGKLLKTYKSGSHAIETEGIKCRGYNDVNITVGGFVWVTEKQQKPDFNKIKERLNKKHGHLRKRVLQIDKSGNMINEFEGVRIACEKTGIDHRSISQVAAGSKIRKSAGGYLWKYKTEIQ